MNSILETFMLLFTADTTDLKKGTKEAKKDVDHLNSSLNSTSALSNKLGANFHAFARQASGALAAFFTVGSIIRGIKSATHFSDELGKLSEALGIDTQELSAWGDAVKLSGGTAEGFQETVKRMTAALSDFATKGRSRAAPFFKELGIRMVDSRGKARSFLDLLPEISDAFQKISNTESLGIGQKMGLDIGTIILLQKGRIAVEAAIKRQKELGVVTKQDAEIAAEFNDTMDDTAHVFRTLYTTIGSYVLPPLVKVLKGFESVFTFLREHGLIVKGVIIGLGSAIAIFLLPPLVTAAAAVITLVSPFLAVAAAIGLVGAAITLAYDDFQHFKAGNNSVIGEIVKKWPNAIEVFKKIIALMKIIREYINGVLLALGNITHPLKAWKIFWGTITEAIKKTLSLFPKVHEFLDALGDKFRSVPLGIVAAWKSVMAVITHVTELVQWSIDKVVAGYNKLKSLVGLNSEQSTKFILEGQKTLSAANSSPLASQTTNSLISSSRALTRHTSVQTGDIVIQTQSSDPEGISNEIGNSLKAQIQKAINGIDDGVAA